MCAHSLVACTPASGWEKGQVENQVGLMGERCYTPCLRVKSIKELNKWLLDRYIAHAKSHSHPENKEITIWQAFEVEWPSLISYVGAFDSFNAVPVSISKTCLIRFDNNRCSVMASAVGRLVDMRAYWFGRGLPTNATRHAARWRRTWWWHPIRFSRCR